MRNCPDAETMASILRRMLAEGNLSITNGEALEIVVRQCGLESWNELATAAGQDEPVRVDHPITLEPAVPILRIFDIAKANEFYLGFLGFRVDWEHRYGDNFPLYMQISRSGLRLHLSEHAGDATPGAAMCVYMSGIRALHKEISAHDYRYMKPGLHDEGERLELSVIDPFANRIRFIERKPR